MSELEQNDKFRPAKVARDLRKRKMTKVDKIALFKFGFLRYKFLLGLLKNSKTVKTMVWSHQNLKTLDWSGDGCEWFPSTWFDLRDLWTHSG